jgi:hypothetical protein
MMILMEHELGFIRFLKMKKVTPNEYEFQPEKMAPIQD